LPRGELARVRHLTKKRGHHSRASNWNAIITALFDASSIIIQSRAVHIFLSSLANLGVLLEIDRRVADTIQASSDIAEETETALGSVFPSARHEPLSTLFPINVNWIVTACTLIGENGNVSKVNFTKRCKSFKDAFIFPVHFCYAESP
jgi:hypothetical protein